jgi:hypothetical protein
MPLTEKGEKIKGAMEEKYGKERGEEVFYASKNKGTISGVDSMSSRAKLDEIAIKADALVHRFDTFLRRRMDSRKRMDEFEEARHPRNAGGVFTIGGEEAKEKEEKTDDVFGKEQKPDSTYRGMPVVEKGKSDADHLHTGALSKKNI